MSPEQRHIEIATRAQELAFVFVSGDREYVANELPEIANRREALAMCALVMFVLD